LFSTVTIIGVSYYGLFTAFGLIKKLASGVMLNDENVANVVENVANVVENLNETNARASWNANGISEINAEISFILERMKKQEFEFSSLCRIVSELTEKIEESLSNNGRNR